MRVCVYEDRADQLEPLSLTRPVFELLCGLTSLATKHLRHFRPEEFGLFVRPGLEEITRLRHPDTPVNNVAWLQQGPTILVNGRWLPPRQLAYLPQAPAIGVAEGEVAYIALAEQHVNRLMPHTFADFVEHWQNTLPAHAAGGSMLRHPWDLVEQNGSQIERDFAAILDGTPMRPAPLTFATVGPREDLWLDPSARIEPFVVADTSNGPVVIDHDAVVTAFSRLEGPCYVGPHSQVHGAKVRAGTTVGPHCRVGGEVEASIIHGYTNKYHEGFLGHSYLGEWVNLGAGTHNSDLRNDYGEVEAVIRGRTLETGLTKVGCFVGDHSKTGLGTLLNTGTTIGAFCNVLPAGRFAPKYVPSFTNWWKGALSEGFPLGHLLNTARTVMQRRGLELTEAHTTLYSRLWLETADERRATLEPAGLLRRPAA